MVKVLSLAFFLLAAGCTGLVHSPTLKPLDLKPLHGELGYWWSALALNPELGSGHGIECSDDSDPNAGSGPERYHRCVRAAEHWVAVVSQDWDCETLRPRDTLDAFEWTCVSGPTTRIESSGLKSGRGLRDFIDSHGQWKSFQLIVEGAPSEARSQPVQFKNPIKFFPLGVDPPAELHLQNEIIAIDVGSTTRELVQGLRILGNNLGFTTLGNGSLHMTETGSSNCRIPPGSADPDAATDGPVTGRSLLCLGASRSYFEGKFSGSGNVELIGTTVGSRRNIFNQIKAVRSEQSRTAIAMRGRDSSFFDVHLRCGRVNSSSGAAFRLHGAHNLIDKLSVHSCNSIGLSVFSDFSLIRNVVVSDSGGASLAAISLAAEASSNTLVQSKAIHNHDAGIRVSSKGLKLIDIVSAHNASAGIEFVGTSPISWDFTSADARLVNILTYANGAAGVILTGNPNSLLLNVMSLNNFNSGVFLNDSFSGLDLVDLVLSNSGYRNLTAQGFGQSEFFGNLVIPLPPLDCTHNLVTGDFGFDGTTCALTGPSVGQTLYHRPASVDFQNFFQSASSDDMNPSDNNGIFSNPSTADFYNFDSPFRFITKAFGFNDTNQRGRWFSHQAKIVDLSLVEDMNNNFFKRSENWGSLNERFVPGGLCPVSLRTSLEHSPTVESAGVDGDNDGVCESGETCQTLASLEYLRLATEVIGDLVGNENGLCEKGDECIYRPNFGLFQGSGSLSEPCLSPGSDSSWSTTKVRAWSSEL